MSWHDVAERAELARAGWLEVEAGSAALLLYDLAGTVHATSAICPHHAAWLSQGRIDGDLVSCPRHMGQFHIPTGRKTRGPDCPDLRVHAARVESGRVLVDV